MRYTHIVHPESFRSNSHNAIAFARRNRPRVKRNDEFICVRLRLRAFASTVRDQQCARTCVHTSVRTYILYTVRSRACSGSSGTTAACVHTSVRTYILYTVRSRACSGSSGTTAAGRFQPNRIFRSRTHRRTASSARLPHQPGSARPPRSVSPLARSTSYASLDHSFARIVCAYIDIRSSVLTRAHIHVYAHALVSA